MQPVPVHSKANPKALIEEYRLLLARVAEAEVRITREVGVDLVRLAAIKEVLESWYLDHPADHPDVLEAPSCFLEVTPCEFERQLDLKAKRRVFAAMKKKLGADPLGLFGVTQETVKATLGAAAIKEYYSKERTGQRKYKIVPKVPPAVSDRKAA